MIYSIGPTSKRQAVHFGASPQPESVTCGNWSYGCDRLKWTDEMDKVTCKGCLKRLERVDQDK